MENLFPLDFHRDSVLSSSSANHASAIEFQADVDTYINEELKHGAMWGPFDDPHFPVHTSPLMTREKQNSATRRIIVDLIKSSIWTYWFRSDSDSYPDF